MSTIYLLLFSLVALVQGFAITKEGLALTAKDIYHESPISMQPYKNHEVLADNQDWLKNKETSQIYLKFHARFVLGVNGNSIQLFDTQLLGENVKNTHWTIVKSGDSYHIQNKEVPSVVLGSSGRIRETPAVQFVDTVPTFDYIVVGAGTAGAKVAKRLSDDFDISVVAVEAGARVNDDPAIQNIITWHSIMDSAPYNFGFYTEATPKFGGRKIGSAVGRMWGGTSGHNGMIYDKGLPYDWALVEKYGGPNWNYETIKAEYLRSENYTGPISGAFGTDGELDIVQTPTISTVTTQPFITAAQVLYPTYTPGRGINIDPFSSSTSYQITVKNLGGGEDDVIREWSATAHLGEDVVDKQGNGVYGRKLQVVSVAFVSQLIFHPVQTTRAIGVQYIGDDSQVHVIYANKEVILSAGAYNSPTVLLRSGVGNCTELSALNIPCVANNEYVGANLHDHVNFNVALTTPPELAVGLNQRLYVQAHMVEGRIKSKFADKYTDYSVTSETQPDTKFFWLASSGLSGAAALQNFNSTSAGLPIFSISPTLVRSKSIGKVSLVSTNPTAAPKIEHNYLSDPDDYSWTVSMYRDIIQIIDELAKVDPRYKAVYPSKEIVEDDKALATVISSLVGGYNHPTGSLRMAPRDNVNQGVVDGNLCVYGLDNVRVADASVFYNSPSGNTQAPTYALAGRAADIIKSTRCSSQ
eukprot:Phypoly_transcript_04498.p1 GENE.Phypoly_transcript_04498~~Phypoly_transcript_04498.p1  ORF type:complete len:696 (+),score=102.67 Phypoly_transcript_04498:58-2145(+)